MSQRCGVSVWQKWSSFRQCFPSINLRILLYIVMLKTYAFPKKYFKKYLSLEFTLTCPQWHIHSWNMTLCNIFPYLYEATSYRTHHKISKASLWTEKSFDPPVLRLLVRFWEQCSGQKKCVLWGWKYGYIKRVIIYVTLKFMVPGDILAVQSEYLTLDFKTQNLTSSLIFAPVGQTNDTNTHNYHSHLLKWCITNQKSWYILQRLCRHTYWLQTIFLYMMYSSLADNYQSFGGMCSLHHCPRGDNTFIWYNGAHLSNHMASHFRIKWSSWSQPWELQISQYILISLIAENM